MHRSLLPAVLSAALALGACDKAGESPVQPSTYGNPVLQLPPPIVRFQPDSATLVSASPASGVVLTPDQTVEAVVEFTLPPEAYPGDVFLSLDAGRIAFGCGHVALKDWPGPLLAPTQRISCHRSIDEGFLRDYREYGQGEPLNLRFSVFGPDSQGARYQRFWWLPLTYTVRP